MRFLWVLFLGSFLLVALSTTGFAQQDTDLSGAQALVDDIRENDPPQVSTETKPSPEGQNASDYRPEPPSMKVTEPPSPVNKNNPQNDPDVQAGFDAHQKWYNSKE